MSRTAVTQESTLTTPINPSVDNISIDINTLEDSINQAIVSAQALEHYLSLDPTIIDLPHWKALAEQFIGFEATLTQLKEANSSHLTRYTALENKIKPYSLSNIDTQLDALEHSIHNNPNTELLDTLRIDPWALSLFTLKADRKHCYDHLYQRCINTIADDITKHHRTLFLEVPRSEFLDLKSERCPHYLALTQYFNQLNVFVQSDILDADSISKRTAIMERWIAISKRCFEQEDYASVLPIRAAFNASSIYRLHASRSGLSIESKKILEDYNTAYDRQSAIIAPKSDTHIPYMGADRHTLDVMKARSNGKWPTPEAEQLADHFKHIQEANRAIAQPPELASLQNQIKRINVNNTLEKELYNKSIRYEPKNTPLQPTSFFKHEPSALSRFENPVLVTLLIEKGLHSTKDLDQEAIEQINMATAEKYSHHKFKKIMNKAGFEINSEQAIQINHENYQIIYRRHIQNNTLRKIAKDSRIHSKLGASTREQLKTINTALTMPINTESLDALLEPIHITATPSELRAIIAESQHTIKANPYLSGQQAWIQFEQALKNIPVSETRKQLNHYLVLINNQYDAKQLRSELNINNPYMQPINQLLQCAQQLRQEKTRLSYTTTEHQTLLKNIDQSLEKLSSRSYQSLINQHKALSQWSASTEQESALQHVTTIAPDTILSTQEAQKLYENTHKKAAEKAIDPAFKSLRKAVMEQNEQLNALTQVRDASYLSRDLCTQVLATNDKVRAKYNHLLKLTRDGKGKETLSKEHQTALQKMKFKEANTAINDLRKEFTTVEKITQTQTTSESSSETVLNLSEKAEIVNAHTSTLEEDSASHFILHDIWDYMKHHPTKTVAGTLIGGVLFVKLLPISVAATAITALSIKFGAGAAIGTAATAVCGASKNIWCHLFSTSTETAPDQKTDTEKNNPSAPTHTG